METQTDSNPSNLDIQFNFWQQWYPVAPLEDLDPQRPTAITLLGQHFVIWQPKHSDQYLVFQDLCPHRLAPLSEGRIDEQTGQLMCSYHGWQFDQEGLCTHIPQAEAVTPKQGQLYCVTAVPTQAQSGLLWVWPDPDTREIAATQPLPLSPLINADQNFVWSSVMRDLAYDWQTLVENVSDPSHVPFAHHGVQGNRNQAAPIPMEVLTSTPELIEVLTTGKFSTTITFQPPCRLEYQFSIGEGKQAAMVTYCIPIAPGRSRIVALFARNFATGLMKVLPRWVEHMKNRNPVLDGDMILLRAQEKQLLQHTQTQNWQTAYKLPTSADRLVIEYRRWFEKYGHGQIPWGSAHEQMPVAPNNYDYLQPLGEKRPQILDRYHQHTLICSSCRRALSRIKLLQKILVAVFAIAISGTAILPDSLRVTWGIPMVLIGLLGLGIYYGLKYWLEPKFYFVDYIHAHH